MISKETFVNIMNRLEIIDKKMDKVDAALKELSHDFCGFYVPECVDIVMDILYDSFNDKDRWLDYFVYELDFLHNKDDNEVYADTWDKVYDFLIASMEDTNE